MRNILPEEEQVQDIINSHIYNHIESIPFPDGFENKCLSFLKQSYLNEINKMQLDSSDKTFFSWLNYSMNIHLCIVPGSKINKLLVIAEKNPSEHDVLNIHDYTDSIRDYDIENSGDSELIISYLVKHSYLKVNSRNIITQALNPFFEFKDQGILWAKNEYDNASNQFSKPSVKKLDFNKIGLHAARYEFDKMINTLDNKQFEIELSESLTAYEKGMFYVCAAGLGGIIESLLYYTLENYSLTGNGFPNDPTLSDFLNKFKSVKLVDRRKINSIKATFQIRNSISHFNDGFTTVDQCNLLMSGIKNIYTNYYLPSLEWKNENPNSVYGK
ncbi:MAG: hypothetical protein LIR10_07020 [Bacillota bacterium]|nr:hypothetical protein [Bacillota bacterium]